MTKTTDKELPNESEILPDSAPVYDRQLKSATQELLKFGVLEASNKPNLYHTCLQRNKDVAAILEPLDLKMKIDDIRGLVFLLVVKQQITETDGLENNDEVEAQDDWQHPLVRRQRMNLEQSLMVAILRQHFVAHELEAGVGDHRAIVHLDELLPQLNQFLGVTGSEAKEEKRLRLLLEQLKSYGLVSDIDENEKLTIKPLIAHVANPENLKGLIATLKKQQKAQLDNKENIG